MSVKSYKSLSSSINIEPADYYCSQLTYRASGARHDWLVISFTFGNIEHGQEEVVQWKCQQESGDPRRVVKGSPCLAFRVIHGAECSGGRGHSSLRQHDQIEHEVESQEWQEGT